MIDADNRFEVSIETWGDGAEAYDPEYVGELTHSLEIVGGSGPAVSVGGPTGGVGASFGVDLSETLDVPPPHLFAEVCNRGVDILFAACEKLGWSPPHIAKVEVFTGRYLIHELEQEPEQFVGVAEVATELEVSRQRVSELRSRHDFPAPIAELASGPVWTMSSLRRFVAEWPRKPGRPRRRDVA
jgi:hypothetical protein